MMNNLLYIGLNGYAGAGKDTVAKMLYVILNSKWPTREMAFEKFQSEFSTGIRPYATLKNTDDNMCTCIAFADRLKQICADLFGIPIEYFYYNKGTAWICINKDFEYTETAPADEFIVTAEDYYGCKDNYIHSTHKYYMSLREILVYVGTYVCQYNICRNVFVNSISNTLKNKFNNDQQLKYVICTDVRFVHEYDFIKKNNGIMINIVRKGVKQADDIAEHEMDMIDPENYNYIITNNSTYEDLFNKVWDIVNKSREFDNITIDLPSRTHTKSSYLRLVGDNVYKLCTINGINKVSHYKSKIISIDPIGGPEIVVGEGLFKTTKNCDASIVTDIVFNKDCSEYLIYIN